MMGWDCAALAGITASAIFDLGGVFLLRRWFGQASLARSGFEPATFFRPIKPGVSGLREKLDQMADALQGGDEILIGVTAGSTEEDLAREWAGNRVSVRVVACPGKAAEENPKIRKLEAMSGYATRDQWIVMDAEAEVSPSSLGCFRTACLPDRIVTAAYYFTGESTVWDRMDQAGFYSFFWPGVGWARLGRADFTFGACLGLSRSLVERLGGWQALRSKLAEDFWIGKLAAAQAIPVDQAPCALALAADRLTLGQWWSALRRRAVTYRTSRPGGFLGSIVTQGPAWAVLLVGFGPAQGWRWIVFGAYLLWRTGCAGLNRHRISEGKCVLRWCELPLALVVQSCLEAAAWMIAWIYPKIRWGSLRMRVTADGSIRRE